MSDTAIGRLERVGLREVWKHEAFDFTCWLQENIDVLNSELDITLVNIEREKVAGSFNIDLVAEDEDHGTVIIENQLEKSNHDHLGKVITYLTAMGAKAAIWIVSEPRPEHVTALTWLNQSGGASFYMVKVEAVRIGSSPPAPLFTLIVGPSDEVKEVGKTKKEIAERSIIRKQWWTQLIDRSEQVSKLHAHIAPSEYSWIGTSAGIRGLGWNFSVSQNECMAELYIDRGKDAEGINKSIFDQLYAHKNAIEEVFGSELKWERLENRRASRIRYIQEGGYRSPEELWPQIQDRLIRGMNRLETSLRPFLKKLDLSV